jgi:hypothetical protein
MPGCRSLMPIRQGLMLHYRASRSHCRGSMAHYGCSWTPCGGLKPHYGSSMPHNGESMPHNGGSMRHYGESVPHKGESMRRYERSMCHYGESVPHYGRSVRHYRSSIPRYGGPGHTTEGAGDTTEASVVRHRPTGMSPEASVVSHGASESPPGGSFVRHGGLPHNGEVPFVCHRTSAKGPGETATAPDISAGSAAGSPEPPRNTAAAEGPPGEGQSLYGVGPGARGLPRERPLPQPGISSLCCITKPRTPSQAAQATAMSVWEKSLPTKSRG